MSSYVWGVIQSTCICIYLLSTESVLRHVFHRTRYRLHNIHVFQTIYFRWLLCLGTAVTSYIDYFHFRTSWYLSVVFWFLHHISTIDIIAICSHGFFHASTMIISVLLTLDVLQVHPTSAIIIQYVTLCFNHVATIIIIVLWTLRCGCCVFLDLCQLYNFSICRH